MYLQANPHWVQQELLPFLDAVFGGESNPGHPSKTIQQWQAEIRDAENQISKVTSYDNSIITVDRIRLALAKSPKLSAAERQEIEFMTCDPALCLIIFVRHAITQGPYPMVTLGLEPNPNATREREMLHKLGRRIPYVCAPGIGPPSHGGGRRESVSHTNGHGPYAGYSSAPPQVLSAAAGSFVPDGYVNSSAAGVPKTNGTSAGNDQSRGRTSLGYSRGGDLFEYINGANGLNHRSTKFDFDTDEFINRLNGLALQDRDSLAKESVRFPWAPDFIPGASEHLTLPMLEKYNWFG
ncbi:hypothetical protein K458DRAFT_396024 [Lentithecium fluviatile CBS 122367]|uniref:Uncharacterized protein n=1 Tax=Lentithecium fluviatile CBS 122367 TaxID=1168545 RepID=A0A6G1IGH2_9PLEO|nr:hypothetical protein K458DRAFT_396024 [Lentithecium fluviatile CBS 122367]